MAVLVLCGVLRPKSAIPGRLLALLAVGVVLAWATGFRYEIPGGKSREVSFHQFVVSMNSITSDE